LNVLDKDLSENARLSKRLIFEYQVTGSDEYIKIESFIENDQLYSMLSYRKEGSEWIDLNQFDFNTQKRSYKKSMNFTIERLANRLKRKYDVWTISRIANILEGLPEKLYHELGREEYSEESTLSIFYHLAMFSAARRAYENDSDCKCGVNESYKNGESPFFCAEDIIVSADKMYEAVKKISERKFAGKDFIPQTLLNYLTTESGQYVTASVIDKLFKDEAAYFWKTLTVKEKQQVYNEYGALFEMTSTKSDNSETYNGLPLDPECLLMGVSSGRDCGCCGNYPGACLVCSILCLAHDAVCVDCLKDSWWSWTCLGGCIPGC